MSTTIKPSRASELLIEYESLIDAMMERGHSWDPAALGVLVGQIAVIRAELESVRALLLDLPRSLSQQMGI